MTTTPKATAEQAKDTGLAMVLILLLAAHFGRRHGLLVPAIAVLVLTMTWPAAFRPLARWWFGLSHLLGAVASKILLTLVFALVATPIGVLRGLAGADPMARKAWKQGQDSVFRRRDHTFGAGDLEKPY